MTGTEPQSMDVDTFVDSLKLSSFHYIVMAICVLLTAIDGYELYVVGWVLPLLAKDFGVPNTAVTSAMVAQQIGMLIGAFLIPPFADRYGRPRVLIVCYAGMMLSALGILTAHSLTTFAAWRFVAGLCGTAMIPILVTLASENAPRRLRGTMSAIAVSGTMLGSLFGAIMQATVLEPFGWRGAFWIAAILPAIMLPLVWFFLPDSLRALVARNPQDRAIPALVTRLQPAGAAPVTIVAVPRAHKGGARGLLSDILGPEMRTKTLLMWSITVCSFVFITASVWKTTIFKDVLGLSLPTIAAVNATNTLAGAVGMLSIGFFIDRFGFKPVMVGTFLLAATGCILTGVTAPGPLMFVAVAMVGMFQHGGQASVAALAAALYPASHRATGVGWAYGAGRVASIFAPLFGTFVLGEGSGFGPVGIFALLSVPLALAGIFTFWLMSLSTAPKIQRAQLAHG